VSDISDTVPSVETEAENERRVMKKINEISEQYLKQSNEFLATKGNSLGLMTGGGAKGQPVQVGQLTALVGQQMMYGKRLEKTMTDKKRCLPTFDPDDPELDARGFCRNSYWDGLTPEELFFAAIAGREGLINTSVKTPVSGDTQRKMIKASESISVANDGSVRGPTHFVYQPTYGGNGFDTSQLIRYNSPFNPNGVSYVNFRSLADSLNAKAGWIRK
jgi:DNA-directed RNA polymerase II subunit RPB1